ncbi:MAG: MaoC/PaaZ C-terminal domain-containing protein [Pseudomonadota bacterium]
MAINYETLKARAFPPVEQSYTSRDTILYALGIGLGADPLAAEQLRFTFEEADGFAALPTIACVLGTPGFWAREVGTGITWQKILHGEQGFEIHAPIPPEVTVVAQNRIVDIIDKGADKGALIYLEREITDKATGQRLATTTSTTFARGDGGFGGPTGPVKPVHALPERDPDAVMAWPVLPQAALIYRLSGDPNPLHASPEVAAAAGFKAPILHGLCTLGIAGWAVLKTMAGGDPARMKALQLRFSAPVFPGETVTTQMWRDGDIVSFRALVGDRVVLNNGKAVVSDG